MSRLLRLVPLAALLATGACAYDYAGGYAPTYPAGYDAGMGSGQYAQPGDLFGGEDVASVEAFDEPLAQYGDWVDSRFGRAFRPDVGPDWRPYVNGRWGEERLWISDDPWGWATDHYGRWGHDDRIGWVWVPGTQWAPSWVAWREDEGQDVAGWSPIPPGVSYSAGIGFGGGFGYDNWNSWYAPGWVWVPRNNIYSAGFGGRVLPWNNGYNYWRGSRWDHRGGPRPGGWAGNPGRPGGWNGTPGRPPGGPGRPRPGISEQVGGAIAGIPPRSGQPQNWQGRPNAGQPGNWQGRPTNGQPGNWQGRPGAPGVAQGRPPGARPDGTRPNWGQRPPGGRPASIGEAVGGGIAAQAPRQGWRGGQAAATAAPVARAPQPAPQPRVERPQRPQQADRPQRSDRGGRFEGPRPEEQ